MKKMTQYINYHRKQSSAIYQSIDEMTLKCKSYITIVGEFKLIFFGSGCTSNKTK